MKGLICFVAVFSATILVIYGAAEALNALGVDTPRLQDYGHGVRFL